jgi:hypothetical protein
MEMEESLRPGDVSLCDVQRKGYLCTHESCRETLEPPLTSWFQLLLHVRNRHCVHTPPWAYSPDDSDLQETSKLSNPSCFVRAENGDWLSIESLQRSTCLSDESKLELNYVLHVLYAAVFSGSVQPEVPQLMYDLYYSTVCPFSNCQEQLKDVSEYRSVYLLGFVTST